MVMLESNVLEHIKIFFIIIQNYSNSTERQHVGNSVGMLAF